MTVIQIKGQQDSGVSRVSEGEDVEVRGTRDGALFTQDWRQAMVVEGRGFMFNVGAFSTPITGGGTGSTKPDDDSPDFYIHIPSGTSIMPIRVGVAVGAPTITADDNEVDILLGVDQDASHQADATAAGTAEVLYNMNTLHSRSSNCVAYSKNSTSFTDTLTVDIELVHVYKVSEEHTSVGVLWQGLTLLYEPKTPVIINGPAMFIGWVGGTIATTYFADIQFLEIPTSML